MRLLLVEDDPDMSRALSRALEKRGHHVTACFDGAEALRLMKDDRLEVAILDLSIPIVDGLHVLQRLRAQGNALPVLILTARGSVGDRVAGLNAGADDYLPKPFDLDELVARLQAIGRRRQADQDRVLRCADLRYDTAAGAPYLDDEPLDLTPRENALLRALMRRPGHAVPRDRLLRMVFNDDESAQVDALDVVVHRLRKKLGVSNAEVMTLRGVGYLLRERSSPAPGV